MNFRPPRPGSMAAREAGLRDPTARRIPYSQFVSGRVDPEEHRPEEDLDQSGVGSMRRRVVPPTGFNGGQFNLDDEYNGVMDSGYYTDLLVNDVEEPEHPTPPSDATIHHHAPATAKSSQGRSKNFRDEEDILLVSAWLNVGMDAIQGTDQPQGTFWTRIHEYFHANKTFESNRTEGSLMNRWSGLQHDVNAFCGCLTRIEGRNHSGWSVDDKIASACTLFKAEDPKHRKFAYLHCWRILKDKPKWLERRKEIGSARKASNKKQKTVANSSPGNIAAAPAPAAPAAGGADGEPSERPDGRKKEKQKLRQRSTIEAVDYLMEKKKEADLEKELKKELKKEGRCNKAFALQEERIKLEKEKFEFQRELEEERILCLDLTTMNDRQQQYYERRQNEILARRFNI